MSTKETFDLCIENDQMDLLAAEPKRQGETPTICY